MSIEQDHEETIERRKILGEPVFCTPYEAKSYFPLADFINPIIVYVGGNFCGNYLSICKDNGRWGYKIPDNGDVVFSTIEYAEKELINKGKHGETNNKGRTT